MTGVPTTSLLPHKEASVHLAPFSPFTTSPSDAILQAVPPAGGFQGRSWAEDGNRKKVLFNLCIKVVEGGGNKRGSNEG